MTAPVDKREYLISLGLAKPGRGRFSRDAIAALEAAEKAGTVFADKSVPMATVTVLNAEGERVQETRVVDPFAPHADAIRTGMLTFVNGKDKLSVNATEACHACSFSFGWCYCDVPTFSFWKTGAVYSLNG